MLTREQILEDEEISDHQQKLVHETFANKDASEKAYRDWVEACRDHHQTTLATDYLWSGETQQKIRDGDRESMEDVLLFLETDPWFFRSGYLKELLLENLRQAPLTEDDKARLRQVILSVAGGKNRREFKRYCSLAVKITTDEFEGELEKQAKEHKADSSGKLSYLLRYVREHRHDY